MTFILTNGQKGFAYIGDAPRSRYEGVFFPAKNKMYKVLSNLLLQENIENTTNLLWAVERKRGLTERYCMPEGYNALQYELSNQTDVTVQFDCKEMNDNREWGRKYKVRKKDKMIIVEYNKTNDNREPEGEEYKIFTAITGDNLHMAPLDRWDPIDCSFDRRRHSPPFQRWAYAPFKLRSKKICFGFGMSTKEAIEQAKAVWENWDNLQSTKEKYVIDLIHKRTFSPKPQLLAYQCCINSLYGLLVNQEWLMAGLPWFYQNWGRDELISAKAVSRISPALMKRIIMRYIDRFSPEAKSHPETRLNAADVPGWLFLRAQELNLTGQEQKKISGKIKSHLDVIKLKNGLVHNRPKETWMDTTWQEQDSREGACIEIQALTLAACRTYSFLTGKKHPLEDKLRKKTKSEFWNGKILKDRSNDATLRPNVFIAAYAYPQLLTKKDWVTCIKNTLKEIWLPWGGLSSISRKHKLYAPYYTGETNQSYHRGDSWYWMNNIAAIVMNRIGKQTFNKYVKQIINASTKEVLDMGASAHHAEVSSAHEQTSDGCQAQAWSAATYIELMDELK